MKARSIKSSVAELEPVKTAAFFEWSRNLNPLHIILEIKLGEKGENTEEKAKVCCLGDEIYSIPCCISYFSPAWFEEND